MDSFSLSTTSNKVNKMSKEISVPLNRGFTMKTFPNREAARYFRSAVNNKVVAAGSKAKLGAPVKVMRGNVEVWSLPDQINHGGKLSLKTK